jgi:hypothetical protein
MNPGQRSANGGTVRIGIRVMVQAIPQCDDESGFLMPHRSSPRIWPCNRRVRNCEGRGDSVFAHQNLSAVGMGSNLGDDGMGPEPNDRVVRFLDQQWSIKGKAEVLGHLYCGTVTRRYSEPRIRQSFIHAPSLTQRPVQLSMVPRPELASSDLVMTWVVLFAGLSERR